MPKKHKDRTIAFRPTEWDRVLIEERASLSGMTKKDFYTRSCLYSRIVVVGNKKNVQHIVDELQEMQNVMRDIAGMITSGEFSLSEETYRKMAERFLALTITVVEMINGASYLFGKEAPDAEQQSRDSKEIEQYRHVLGSDIQK